MADAAGRDYSAFQPPVTAAMLRGLSFAYTRVSNWSGTTMGTDPTFAHDWMMIRQHGLHRGAYWYLLPSVDPVAQARHFVNAVRAAGLRPGDMLVCDSEVLASNVNAVTASFCTETARLAGPHCPVLVYSNQNVGQHLTSCTRWPLWFAWPSSTPPTAARIRPWTHWTFWQWGVVNGVDADRFNGTPAQLNAWIARYLPTPNPPPEEDDPDMIMVEAAQSQVPAGTAWPGVWLLFGDGTMSHVQPTVGGISNVRAYQSAGIKGPVTLTWTEFTTLRAIKP